MCSISCILGRKDFPYSEFFSSESRDLIEGKKKSHLCKTRHVDFLCCSCVDNCMETKNCCIDKFWNGTLSLERYLKVFTKRMTRAKQGDSYKCTQMLGNEILKGIKNSESKSYFMISSCDESTKYTRECKQCTNSNYKNMIESIPVLSKDGKLYRSESCAKCNNVTYERLKIEGVCREASKYKNISNLDDGWCKFGIEEKLLPGNAYKCYNKKIRNECTKRKFKNKCRSYISTLNNGFANVDCYKCSPNYDPKKKDLLKEKCGASSSKTILAQTWSFTLDYTGKVNLYTQDKKLVSTIDTCKTNEVFGVVAKTCAHPGDEVNQTIAKDTSFEKYHQIEYYITIIGTCYSLLCYCVLILTYSIFKQLRNIPGLNTLALAVCLFLCDLLFITHDLYSKTAFCKYSGMIKHYLLLASQMWVTIICFDLAMTMHSSISTTNRNKTKTFLKYLAIALLLTPLLFVTPAITLSSVGYIDSAYAEICWINDFKARLWFYITPSATLFVLAIVALLSTFAKIYQTKKDTSKTLGSNKCNVDLVKIAAKLLIGLGFMEILGYFQVLEHNQEFP